MKKSCSMIIMVTLMCMLIATLSVAANSNQDKNPEEKGKLEKQTERYLSSVNQELIVEFDLKNKYDGYAQFTLDETEAIYAGREVGIDYKTVGHGTIVDGMIMGFRALKIGTTEPIIFVKKNGKEIIYLYKDIDSNNCMDIYQFKEDEWQVKNKKEKGNETKFSDFNN